MNRTKPVIVLLFLVISHCLTAANPRPSDNDTLTSHKDRYLSKTLRNAIYREGSFTAFPLLAIGLYLKESRSGFCSAVPAYRSEGDSRVGEGLRLLPMGTTYLLKAFGVPTRSSWERMTVSAALSGLLTVSTSVLIKSGVSEQRPDGSDRRAFPSGHASLAFACATVMHKELGAQSGWYSIGAYGFAALIGFSRVHDNRHWAHDVLFGAGIGILSTDIGYLTADLIYGDKGLEKPLTAGNYSASSFSFLSIGSSVRLNRQRWSTPFPGLSIRQDAALSVQMEGVGFLSSYIGIGGRLRVTEAPVMFLAGDDATLRSIGTPGNHKTAELSAGLYLSFPLTEHLSLSGKVLAGDRYSQPFETDTKKIRIDSNHALNIGTGCDLSYRFGGGAVSLMLDYDYAAPQYRYHYERIHLSRSAHLSAWNVGMAFKKRL